MCTSCNSKSWSSLLSSNWQTERLTYPRHLWSFCLAIPGWISWSSAPTCCTSPDSSANSTGLTSCACICSRKWTNWLNFSFHLQCSLCLARAWDWHCWVLLASDGCYCGGQIGPKTGCCGGIHSCCARRFEIDVGACAECKTLWVFHTQHRSGWLKKLEKESIFKASTVANL